MIVRVLVLLQTHFDQQDNFQSSEDTSKMGDVPFALPSSSKWEVADRQDKMGKNNIALGRIGLKYIRELI